MTKQEFDHFTEAVNGAIGNPRMTWEGPMPHDFRDMKARGVRFVNSPLYVKLINLDMISSVHFKVLVGDNEAAAAIGAKISEAGYKWTKREISEYYMAVEFEVPVCASPL